MYSNLYIICSHLLDHVWSLKKGRSKKKLFQAEKLAVDIEQEFGRKNTFQAIKKSENLCKLLDDIAKVDKKIVIDLAYYIEKHTFLIKNRLKTAQEQMIAGKTKETDTVLATVFQDIRLIEDLISSLEKLNDILLSLSDKEHKRAA